MAPNRLIARLNAARRIRSLHATVTRRLDSAKQIGPTDIETARDATVLLIGRGGAYPTLSVLLGERTGVVGALSIEAAANHLNTRDIDGIVFGEGFSVHFVDAFLTNCVSSVPSLRANGARIRATRWLAMTAATTPPSCPPRDWRADAKFRSSPSSALPAFSIPGRIPPSCRAAPAPPGRAGG
jgi:hypothetical protein